MTFTLPAGEPHATAQFEALTGYMPSEFARFWHLNRTTKKLEPLSDGPGEQRDPVAFSTADGTHAKRYPPRDCKPKCDDETGKSATTSNQAITTTTKKRGDDECDPGTNRSVSFAPVALAIVDTPVFTG